MGVSVFDVIGPIMVGPSSSHTAGAARLGKIAKQICVDKIKKVEFFLHGSFAETYIGHGTDRALLGGILGFEASDERLKDSFSYAKNENIEFSFNSIDMGDVHPNTVKIEILTIKDDKWIITGSSIGGGKILINSINNMKLEFSGQYPTLITFHEDQPGVVATVSSHLSKHGINIAFLKVFRQFRGKSASMIIETDQVVDNSIIRKLEALNTINKILFINKLT